MKPPRGPEVDHTQVFVDGRRFEEACEYVESHPLLSRLSREDQLDTIEIISRFMTALDVELLRQPVGANDVRIGEIEDGDDLDERIKGKAIVVLGTRVSLGVDCECGIVDAASVGQVYGYGQ